jgi:TPR repeat protein
LGHRTVCLLAALLAAAAVAQTGNDLGENVVDAAEAEARGFDFWLGRGVEQDLEQAARWLEQAATQGRPHAAAALAGLYRSGRGVPRDVARAHELSELAALQGIASAQAALGFDAVVAPADVRARELAAALPWLNAAAEQEDPYGLFLLGQSYRFGDGVERNVELGRQLVTRSAELGYPPASAEAGGMLLALGTTDADVQKGLYFLQAAAEAGFGRGAYWLARVYLIGRHVERDTAVAAQWLVRGSDLDVAIATLWLGELYAKGVGVPGVDLARAAELREQALPRLSIGERNEFAWELSVSPEGELRNGAFAVEIAEGVVAERPAPTYIDTLAAAYAESGRFDDAVRAQQRAVDALPVDVPAAMRNSYSERVELYRSGRPYREAP